MTFVSTFITAAISAAVGAGISAFIVYYKNTRKKNKAMHDGLRSLLRADLIRMHEKYTERGYCPIYAKTAAKDDYNAYHELGGNGVITGLYNDLLELPENPPNKNNNKRSENV